MRGLLAMLFAVSVVLTAGSVSAHFVPAPCDKITGGGFIFKDDGEKANFGAHGGCKHDGFWGSLNYVDHGGFLTVVPYHVHSVEITGYLWDPAFPNTRDICGLARTNANEDVRFRVRLVDNGEGNKAPKPDEFGIRLDNGYLVSTRPLADSGPGGGNIQLHKPNPSTTGPDPAPNEYDMCGDLAHPGDPVGGP